MIKNRILESSNCESVQVVPALIALRNIIYTLEKFVKIANKVNGFKYSFISVDTCYIFLEGIIHYYEVAEPS